MELEGLGVSLVGRAIYINGGWIPWEFITGVKYTCKILVAAPDLTGVELENSWNYIIRPESGKDWSILATILRGIGGTVLLTIQCELPASFVSFMSGLISEGRTIVTRIWLSIMPPIPPDAAFFLPGSAPYEAVETLPARGGHGAFGVSRAEWETLVNVAADAELGLVVSDVGETRWSVFWHKLSDSQPENPSSMLRRGIALLKVGTQLVEKNGSK